MTKRQEYEFYVREAARWERCQGWSDNMDILLDRNWKRTAARCRAKARKLLREIAAGLENDDE